MIDMTDVIRGIWSIFAFFPLYLGIFLVPATFYGVLECIKNAVQGKSVSEYKKAFIWTSIGLLCVLAPSMVVLT